MLHGLVTVLKISYAFVRLFQIFLTVSLKFYKLPCSFDCVYNHLFSAGSTRTPRASGTTGRPGTKGKTI